MNKINVNDVLSPISNFYCDISEVRINNLIHLNLLREDIESYIDFDLFISENDDEETTLIKLQLYLSLNVDLEILKEVTNDCCQETEIVYVCMESVYSTDKSSLDSKNFQNIVVRTFLPELIRRMRLYVLQITSFSDFNGYELPVISPIELFKKRQEFLDS